jgi:hypothetical protein
MQNISLQLMMIGSTLMGFLILGMPLRPSPTRRAIVAVSAVVAAFTGLAALLHFPINAPIAEEYLIALTIGLLVLNLYILVSLARRGWRLN